MSRNVKIFLTISITLNLALLGVIGGFMLKHWGHHGHDFRPVHDARLSEETRERVASVMASVREQNAEKAEAARQARRDLLAILRAEQFNPQAYEVQFERLNQLRYLMMEGMAEAMKSVASDLSAEERRILAENMMRGHRRGHKGSNRDRERSKEKPRD